MNIVAVNQHNWVGQVFLLLLRRFFIVLLVKYWKNIEDYYDFVAFDEFQIFSECRQPEYVQVVVTCFFSLVIITSTVFMSALSVSFTDRDWRIANNAHVILSKTYQTNVVSTYSPHQPAQLICILDKIPQNSLISDPICFHHLYSSPKLFVNHILWTLYSFNILK